MRDFFIGLSLGFAAILFFIEGRESKQGENSRNLQDMISTLTGSGTGAGSGTGGAGGSGGSGGGGFTVLPGGCGRTVGSMQNQQATPIVAPGMYPASAATRGA